MEPRLQSSGEMQPVYHVFRWTGIGLCNRTGSTGGQEGERSRASQEEVRRGARNKE